MQRSEGLLNQSNSFWVWLWLPSFQMSPAKDKGYNGQWDTTQSNLARMETSTYSSVPVLYVHMPGALFSRQRHTCNGLPQQLEGILVSPCYSRKSSLPGPRKRSCSLPPSCSATRYCSYSHLLFAWIPLPRPWPTDQHLPSFGLTTVTSATAWQEGQAEVRPGALWRREHTKELMRSKGHTNDPQMLHPWTQGHAKPFHETLCAQSH